MYVRKPSEKSLWLYSYLVVAALFLILTNVVYLRLYLQTPPGYVYSGVGLEAAADKFVYFSMIEQGKEGKLFMRNTHTLEPQRGLLFSPQWLAVGMTSRFMNINTRLAYHLARIILTVPFLIVMFFFIGKLFTHLHYRVLAASTLLLPGTGWLYLLIRPEIATYTHHWLFNFNKIPIDLYVPEFLTLINFMQSPLFLLSYTLIALLFYVCIANLEHPRLGLSYILGGASLFLVLMHPYDGVLLMAITGSWMVFEIMRTRTLISLWFVVPIFFGTVLAYLYHALVFFSEPALAGWLAQNITVSPALNTLLLPFGFVGLLALLGVVLLFRAKNRTAAWNMALAWFLTPFLLVYLPLDINRRFTNTWYLAAGLVAIYAFSRIWDRYGGRRTVQVFFALIGLISVSGLAFQIDRSLYYKPRPEEVYAYYLDPIIWSGIQFANHTFTSSDRILPNNPNVGLFVHAYSSGGLFYGHQHQSINFDLKEEQATWFFNGSDTQTARRRKMEFLAEQRIDYILVYKPVGQRGDWLRAEGGVAPVFENEALVIYHVTQPAA
ncbi:MAG: hypothetical protein A3B30_02035 [Candidatus Komeilibacteria bacterium RIFCSPLOWO2_01_FULL_52_15]|uniref:Glycosyltransferase RgtA/B/C/D-like domain-containing protein n=2 Tax=Candidatus Komeiliibacteriota TaxID=1817908 RepID=A0A1G2BSX7_9BACT|nr:MAG: hypothetical protein A2677_00820 [Candidatus Komeilibacteria bacterium RIFCSPHIGHO2_01_FULL_52_14]OGY92098.1 MAG: hypothetical protein A3B30_02035 [Candidatus Komeilibacteria bacterium RIFCSPLOWO2_01_FULL_52_15]